MQIKTLAEILAESDTDSANAVGAKKNPSYQVTSKPTKTELFEQKKARKVQCLDNNFNDDVIYQEHTDEKIVNPFFESRSKSKKSAKKKKRFHPAATFIAEPTNAASYNAPESQTIKQMLAEVKNDSQPSEHSRSDEQPDANTDNLPSALKAYLRTPEQKQAELDAIKAQSRLRWLAFYYLSRREYGRAELKQKLIDKEQDPNSIDALLDEFEEKGYQSDYRTTLMIIRENIRKGRGHDRIKQEFYKKKITMPSNIDELIDMANTESEEFNEFVDDDEDSLVDGVDWLKLAVTARTRKYGDSLPIEQKEKAKQLRFLQYRGFKADVCFEALNYTLDTLDERF